MKKLNNPRITQAILWAAALIGTALILKGSEQSQEVFMLLLVLAAVSTIVPNKSKKAACRPSSED
ncbi:hypothetical protein [Kordiimonas sp.]|uniref:hypothetical protein n=1 Tax=Kordiimonas sp. TaxID=1970157 RepID=UPI003A91A448